MRELGAFSGVALIDYKRPFRNRLEIISATLENGSARTRARTRLILAAAHLAGVVQS